MCVYINTYIRVYIYIYIIVFTKMVRKSKEILIKVQMSCVIAVGKNLEFV